MIYEIRTYEAMPGKLQALNQRFANITMKYFEKYGLKAVGFWTEDVGTSNTLVYLLAFEDMAQRDRAWRAFRADDQRARAFAETERDGPLVARITNRILRPTDYSPLL
ncbi:MAG: NIPSNAP family protein [Chloroflexi bacterium]|nr:NIPSNAP family protein [Chloroflexota bacterium]